MKAWMLRQTGDVDVLQMLEIDVPTCGENDVLVRNRAIGLNPVDWKFIEWGHPAWSMPHVPGVDGAGEVIAVGSAVRHLRVGMAVAYHNDLLRPGSFAEFTSVPARAVIALPSGISFAAAAAIPCPGLTAQQAIDKVNIPIGSNVLLTGASGAVGGAILQLARSRGWVIHALASRAQHDRVRAMGAAATLDYREPNWKDRAAEVSRDRPFMAVFDVVNGPHAAALAPLLGANGHLVCIQDRQETTPLPAFTTTISLHEVGLNAMHSHGDAEQWARLVATGRAMADAVVDGSFDVQLIETASFEDLPAALGRLKAGPNPGNRVVVL